ncbi:MAG: TRM11 family SAM-dependent methyltransferase [Anaerolineae bacterium]
MTNHSLPYYAHTMPGVEQIAWLEIRFRLPGAQFGEYLFAKDKNGMVLFEYGGEPDNLHQLRTAEALFLQALPLTRLSRSRRDLAKVTDLVHQSADFGRAVNAWTRQRKLPGHPRYRVICHKYGKHDYRLGDLYRAAVAGMNARYPHWPMVEEGADLEVWVNLLGSQLLCGVRLSDRRKKKGAPADSLRPSVAAAMVFLTEPDSADVFLDPLCCRGTVLRERRFAGRYGRLLAGERAQEQIAAARKALIIPRRRALPKATHLFRWDTQRLPLADRSIDKVASALPSGRGAGTRLYPALFAELARVLRPGGRAVLLSSTFELVKETVRRQAGLEIMTGYSMAVAGRWGRIYIIKRTLDD